MKPIRFLIVAIAMFGMIATVSAITPAGTSISNQATGTYDDANGNAMTGVSSNTVTTTVTQVAGVDIGTNQTLNIQSMLSGLYDVTITNTGNGKDVFTIGATGSGTTGFTFEVYHDIDNGGSIDGSDSLITLTDSVALGVGTFNLLVKVTDGDGSAEGTTHITTLTVTSGFTDNGVVSEVITLTSTVQAATIDGGTEITGNPNPDPGETITYQSCFDNDGDATGFNTLYHAVIPDNTTLGAVSIGTGGNLTVVPGGGPSDSYWTGSDTLYLDLGDLPADSSLCVNVSFLIDDPLSAGTTVAFDPLPWISFENQSGDPYTDVTAEDVDPDDDADGVVVDEVYDLDIDDGTTFTFSGDPSDTLLFAFSVTNDGNTTDSVAFSDTSAFVTWVFYLDSNDDGFLSGAEKLAGPLSAPYDIAEAGVVNFIAIGTIPAGTADASVDNVSIVATSVGAANDVDDPEVVSDFDTAAITVTAPTLTLVKTVDNATAAPGDTLTYTVTVLNSGTGVATNVVVTDVIPTNTTYVAESMTIDGTGDDDALNGAGDHAFKAANSVVFDFDSIAATTGGDNTDQRILTFKVTID